MSSKSHVSAGPDPDLATAPGSRQALHGCDATVQVNFDPFDPELN